MDLVYPRIERDIVTRTYGRFIISPLERGFGITIGNALRRVLLSSLSGAAVSSIRVTGIHHEFSPIPGAKEDMTQLILNIKQLRVKSYSEDPIRMRVNARGEGKVTAADIQVPSQVEIINPELHLLTLDSEDAAVEVEMTVQRGRGYSPADERGRLPIDEIPVDAIYSPIRRARFDVARVRFGMERERSGSSADYDKLILSIWTDGTISADDALSEGSSILMRHFQLTASVGELPDEPIIEPEEEGIPDTIADRPIEDLGLQVRAFNCLKRAGITSVGEVLERLQKGRDEMLAIRNFGEKSLEELLSSLKEKGYGEYITDID
ncbi:MAG: DNA-directed RNA polymerase subunit alpha [Ardenticatenaceae bacterium]